jgi:hypothetical protein
MLRFQCASIGCGFPDCCGDQDIRDRLEVAFHALAHEVCADAVGVEVAGDRFGQLCGVDLLVLRLVDHRVCFLWAGCGAVSDGGKGAAVDDMLGTDDGRGPVVVALAA